MTKRSRVDKQRRLEELSSDVEGVALLQDHYYKGSFCGRSTASPEFLKKKKTLAV